jgi:hypothetical protein
MSHWTATTTTNATPDRLLAVLTHPDEIKRWSPVDFDLDDLEQLRVQTGTRTRVTGALAGVKVAFDVEVQTADEEGLALTADGPVGLDVRYDLVPADRGAELSASVSLRRGRGRLVGGATAALLSSGVLEGAAGRIARRAELAAAA